MKKSIRIFATVTIILFTVHANNMAQNPIRKKAQVSPMKSNQTTKYQVVSIKQNISRYIYLKEGFDNDFLPLGWNQVVANANNTWSQLNPENSNFNEIDSLSKFSAMIPWATEYQDEWIISNRRVSIIPEFLCWS